uniref:OBP47-like domain-containing protein n=1 Tax=Anopheles funestus TaxID=62324 RepID=A0A4Y0BRF1_ANOFN
MATTINSIKLCSWTKVLMLLWFAQLAIGESNSICKKMPSLGKEDSEDKCCSIPEVFPNETLHQCMGDLEQSSLPQLQKSCQFSICVLKKHNLLKGDRVDADQIKAYIKDKVKASDEWKSLMEKAVLQDCMPMVEKDNAMVKQMKTALGDCEPIPALTVACAAAKLYANCPAKDYTGSPLCDEWKTFLSKCSSSMDDLNEIYMLIETQKLT